MDTVSTERSLMSRWFGPKRTWFGILADVTCGIVLPVIGFIISRSMSDFILDEVGAVLSPYPRLGYLYTIVVLVMLALGFWLAVGKHARQWTAFMGGVLLFASLLAAGFAVAAVVRLLLFGLIICVPAMLIFFVYVGNSVRALREASREASWASVAVLALAGMLFVVALSLILNKQPWELVHCLPYCQAADLSNSDLSQVHLSGCDGSPDLSYANLTNADLSHSFLGLCNLKMHRVVMRGADLSHATLDGVDLRGADLRDTNFEGATLYMVDLSGADLRGSQLSFEPEGRVFLEDADLRGADLQDATNLQWAYWDGAKYDASTRWPQGFDPAEFGAVLQE